METPSTSSTTFSGRPRVKDGYSLSAISYCESVEILNMHILILTWLLVEYGSSCLCVTLLLRSRTIQINLI